MNASDTYRLDAYIYGMHGSRKYNQRGANSDNLFFNEGREDPNSNIGPSSAREQNAI